MDDEHKAAGDGADGPGRGADSGDTLVTLGRITAHHGLKGWLKVHSDTEPRDNITTYGSWWIRAGASRDDRGAPSPARAGDPGWRTIDVLEGREQGKTVIVRLAGVEDRETALPFIGADIAVRRADLPPARPGEHYWTDLIGLAVATVEGKRLGTVARLFETGANDVLVVVDERPDAKSGTEILIPWVAPDVIVAVDTAAGTVTVDWDPDY